MSPMKKEAAGWTRVTPVPKFIKFIKFSVGVWG
jgi:hypothetical protein